MGSNAFRELQFNDVFYSFRRFYAECLAPLVAEWKQDIQRFLLLLTKEGYEKNEVITRQNYARG